MFDTCKGRFFKKNSIRVFYKNKVIQKYPDISQMSQEVLYFNSFIIWESAYRYHLEGFQSTVGTRS